MENFDLLAMLLQYGPYVLAVIAGIFIPQEKMPLLKNFIKKTDEELNKEEDA